MDIAGFVRILKEEKAAFLIIFDILLIIAPGIATVFIFKPNLFSSLDWIKLSLLSVAVTAPVVFINTLVVLELMKNDFKPTDKDNLFWGFSMSIFGSGIAIYVLLIVQYFFAIGMRQLMAIGIITEIALMIGLILQEFWRKTLKMIGAWRQRKNS
jgi:hypothetical protein